MDKIEFRIAKTALKLTDPAMAAMLGVSLRTANGYANGDAIPSPVAKLLKLIVLWQLTPDDVPAD